ncbi:MAG: MarR family transcriptional regulator [Myxococcota bacterium]
MADGNDLGDDALNAAQRANVGLMLLKAARLFDERALERIRAFPGSPNVRPAHTRLFPLIRFEGVRATQIADHLGVTKQAITPLIQDLVNWGVVERVPDPADGRARLVRWTQTGRALMLEGLRVFRALEAPWREAVGRETLDTVHDALCVLVDQLER